MDHIQLNDTQTSLILHYKLIHIHVIIQNYLFIYFSNSIGKK
jgi:hypothetical protein